MSTQPLTVMSTTPAEATAIRHAVRTVDPATLSRDCVLAGPEHVEGLTVLLSDPAVSDPIYDLPRPINPDTIARWVSQAQARRRTGDGLLIVRPDEAGSVWSYSLFTIWPECASADISGAYRAVQQNRGAGKRGAADSFGWMFKELGVRLIGVTAAIDNVRSARVIESAGFRPMGERLSVRPDGTTRRSRYWELTREQWQGRSDRDGARREAAPGA